MKIRNYAFFVVVILLFLSAGTDNAKLTEGFRPGNIAPEIKISGTDDDIRFSDRSGYYTLLHFWAAYDAGSRMMNVKLWNKLKQDELSQVRILSISMDKLESVFSETVRVDKLETTNQLQEKLGEQSDLYLKYGLKKGLRNFLIDDDGVILATNVTPEKLSKIINKQGR